MASPLHLPAGALNGFPINNFRSIAPFTPSSCPGELLQTGPLQAVPSTPKLALICGSGAACPLAAMAGFAAHLAEVGSAAELKFEH